MRAPYITEKKDHRADLTVFRSRVKFLVKVFGLPAVMNAVVTEMPVAKVERREAQRLALGARGRLAARGGSVNPASKGASQALWRLPPLHRPRNLAGATGKPRTHRAARTRKRGCLKCRYEIAQALAPNSASYAGLTRVSIIFAESFG